EEEFYTVIENPKLIYLFYERIRAWKPNSQMEEKLKQASDETLTKINDIICEWIDAKEIKKFKIITNLIQKLNIETSTLKGINEKEINSKNDTPLKLTKFVYYLSLLGFFITFISNIN
ncbi:hypothetical protein RFI_21876, partial [Reticulomyxa filosa]